MREEVLLLQMVEKKMKGPCTNSSASLTGRETLLVLEWLLGPWFLQNGTGSLMGTFG